MEFFKVLELKNNRKNESFTASSAWETSSSAWPAKEDNETNEVVVVADNRDVAPTGYVRYRAIYEFFARNSDEITFQPGDIVMV